MNITSAIGYVSSRICQSVSTLTKGLQEMSTPSKVALVSAVVIAGIAIAMAKTSGGAIERFAASSTTAPYSLAVRHGNTLYVSGQFGITDPNTYALAPGGIAGETEQLMQNMAAILTKCGSSLSQVVKFDVFLSDMKDWPAFNAVYLKHFAPGTLPARIVTTSQLAFNATVEASCIAHVPSSRWWW